MKNIKQIERVMGKKHLSWKILYSNHKHTLFEVNNQLIFKFFNTPEYIKRKALEEVVINKMKSSSHCQVPNIQYSGRNFFAYPKIKGHGLNLQLWNNMNKREQSNFATEIAEYLKTLHNFPEPIDGITKAWPPNKDWLHKELSQKLYPKLSMKAQYNISHRLDNALADKEIIAGKQTLVHGDLNPGSIIVDKNKLSGIVDFEATKIMTPAHDFAVMYISFWNQKIVDQIVDKYNRPIDNYFKKRVFFMILLRELILGCAGVHNYYQMLYRLERKYGDMKKAQLYKLITLKYHFNSHYKILKYEGFRKCLLYSYHYRKNLVFDLIRKR